MAQLENALTFITRASTRGFLTGMTHSSNSKIHAPLEVAKGYHMGYIKAKINLNLSKHQNTA